MSIYGGSAEDRHFARLLNEHHMREERAEKEHERELDETILATFCESNDCDDDSSYVICTKREYENREPRCPTCGTVCTGYVKGREPFERDTIKKFDVLKVYNVKGDLMMDAINGDVRFHRDNFLVDV